jgi:hypothetical protein
VIVTGWAAYQIWHRMLIGYYQRRNYHRSLDYALEKEAWWALNKPADEDEWDEEE